MQGYCDVFFFYGLLEADVDRSTCLHAASISLNMSRNSLTEKVLLYSKIFLKIKCGKSKGMQERVSIMGVSCG